MAGTPTYAAMPDSTADGFQSVEAAADAKSITAFGGAGADLDCGAGKVIVGLHLEAYVYPDTADTQQIM